VSGGFDLCFFHSGHTHHFFLLLCPQVTELDNARFAVFLLVMGLVGAAFLPNPGTVDWSFLAGNEAQFSYKQFFGLSPPSDGFDF